MIFRRFIGSTFEQRIRLSRHLPLFDIERGRRKVVGRGWPLSDNGFQIGDIGSKALEKTTRTSTDRESDQRRPIQGWRRNENGRGSRITLF